MDAFELLKTDHKKVAGIFEKLEPTTERALKTREELFTQLKQELDVHAQIEETILYPVLKEADTTHEITLEAYEEHAVIKSLLKELAAEPKDTEEWAAKLTVLKENVEHHVEEEEGEMFPKAEKVLGKEGSEQIGAELQQAKEQQTRTATAS